MSIIYNQKNMNMQVVQRTIKMKKILLDNNVTSSEIFVDPSTDYDITSYLKTLPANRLRVEYPQVVVNGHLIGNLKELEEAQQNGRLQSLLSKVVDDGLREVLKVLTSSISNIKKEHEIQIAEVKAESRRQGEDEQQKWISRQSNIFVDHVNKEKQQLEELERARKKAAEEAQIEADRRLKEVEVRFTLLRTQQPSPAELKAKEERELSDLIDETSSLLSSLSPSQKDDLDVLSPMFPNLFRKTLIEIRRKFPNSNLETIVDHIFSNTDSIEASQPSFPILLANITPFELESGKYDPPVANNNNNIANNNVDSQKVAKLDSENERLAKENEKLMNQLHSYRLEQEKTLTLLRMQILSSIDEQESLLAELQKSVIQTSALIATQRTNLAQVDAALSQLSSQ